MPPRQHNWEGLVRRPRGGRKSKTPTPPPPPSRDLPAPPGPPRLPRTPERSPFDGLNFRGYRDPVVPTPGDESASPGSVEKDDYDPEDYKDAEFYRKYVYKGEDDKYDDDDDETDYSELEKMKKSRRHRAKRERAESSKTTANTVAEMIIKLCKILMIIIVSVTSTLLYRRHKERIQSGSTFDGNRPYYRINQTAALDGQASDTTRSVSLFVHLPNKARNVNITEEIMGGRVCSFNETHAKMSEYLQRYLKHGPTAPSRVHAHPFYAKLVDLYKNLAEKSRFLAQKEYMLCLYTELDVASNFLTASFTLPDIQTFSHLYKARLDEIQYELENAKDVIGQILDQSKELQDMAAGCGGDNEQAQSDNPVCDFFPRYRYIDTEIQQQYGARLQWYTKMTDLAEAAADTLVKTLWVLEAEAKKDVGERAAPIREYVQPFLTAMGAFILAVRAVP